MNRIIYPIFVISLIALQSKATEGFTCDPNPRESHIQVLLTKDEVSVKIINPAGYTRMPQFEGPVSQFLIPFIQMQTEDLKALGSSAEFVWPRAKCKIGELSNYSIDCSGPTVRSSSQDIQAQSLTTTLIQEKTADSNIEKVKYRFVFEQSNFYFVSLVFQSASCFKF